MSIIKYFKSLFKTPEENATTSLQDLLITKKVIIESSKQEYYPEIVENTVRIYSRKTGLVVEEVSTSPKETAVYLLTKYNSHLGE